MMGEVHQENLIDSRRLSPGDRLILTGGLAIEGTAILATQLEEKLKPLVGEEVVISAKELLRRPGISVVNAARVGCGAARLQAVHDLTEGGLAGACHELCRAAGVGMELVQESILIHRETRLIAQALGLDPLGMLASGALLIGVSPDSSGLLLSELDRNEVICCVIGEVTDKVGEVGILRQAERRLLEWVTRDEILKAFETDDGAGVLPAHSSGEES